MHSVCLLLPVHWDHHIWHSIPKELRRELKLCAGKKQVCWTESIVEYLTCNLVYIIWKTTAWQWKQTCLPAHWYTGCPRRNVPDIGRVFLMLKYTYITQNTYIQSWMVTEIMAREKWGLLAVPNTATCTADTSRDNASVLDSGMQCSLCLRDALRSQPCYVTAGLSHV